MTTTLRLSVAASLAIIAALVLSGAEIAGVAVWKIALASCGIALIRYAT
jgi:hypothetical protein